MSHHDDRHHQDHHHRKTEMPFEEKLIKLLEHWIKHNDSHAETYRDWMKQAGEEEWTEVAGIMKDAADLTTQINKKFEQALRSMTRDQRPGQQ